MQCWVVAAQYQMQEAVPPLLQWGSLSAFGAVRQCSSFSADARVLSGVT